MLTGKAGSNKIKSRLKKIGRQSTAGTAESSEITHR